VLREGIEEPKERKDLPNPSWMPLLRSLWLEDGACYNHGATT